MKKENFPTLSDIHFHIIVFTIDMILRISC